MHSENPLFKNLTRTFFALFLLCLGIAVAGAQTSNGTVVGAVTDSTGQLVVSATVTITSVDTGAVRTTTTNSEGTYRIDAVLPGTYNVSASATGFQTTVNKGLVVYGTDIKTSDLKLKVGAATEAVEVSADNAAINTDNGQIDGTISLREINSLPISSLSPYELALTLPGVTSTTQGGFSNGVNFNVGGGRPRANNFLLEGQDNNDAGITGQGFQPENLEAVKEVKVLENSYTAEFGHGAGSVSNMIFQSGTNDFHGAIFERIDNSSLDTVDKQDHFNNVTSVTKYRENWPGFRIGGPVLHNKLFFFGSYQWDFYRSTANLDRLYIPTAAGMATLSQYSSNPRVANLLKAYGGLVGVFNPQLGLPAIDLGPDPVTGVERGKVEMGVVQRNLPALSNAPEIDLTGDYVRSDKDTLRLRMVRNSFTAPYDVWNEPGQLPGFDSDQDGASWNAGIEETHIFSPAVVNEFRVSYGRIGFTFGLPASTIANPLYNQPAVSITNMTGYGIPGAMPQGRFHNTYQVQDTVSWTHGKHFIKIGADLSNTRVRDMIPFNYYGSISFNDDTKPTSAPGGASAVYSGLANLLDDFGGSSSSLSQNFGSPTARPSIYSQNYFVQDTYKPLANLSIDLGLRYEYNGAPFNAPGTPYPGIDLNNIACYPGQGSVCNLKQSPDTREWEPRFGVAYSPNIFDRYKTVFHSGFGVFNDVVFTNIIDNIQASAPNNGAPLITSVATANNNRGTGNWYEQFANLNPAPPPHRAANHHHKHLRNPRTQHRNQNVQQELPDNTTLQVGYIGERGEHLYGQTEVNPFVNDFFSADRVIPTRGNIVVRDNSGDSEYAGLWSQLEHRFSHDFLFRAAYTYGHSFDDVSEIFTFNNESSYQFSRYPTPRAQSDWGPSAYDHRQRLVLSYVYQPPVWQTEGMMKAVGNVVNHWQVAGVTQFQTGSPENVEVGYDVNGDGIGNDRPVLGNPKAPLATYAFDDSWFYGASQGGLCSGPSLWYTSNPCESVTADQVHWIIPAYGTYPAHPVGRNSLYGPGLQQWDMNIQRSFKLAEHVSLDFRGELFNIFNHGNGGIEDTSLISGIPTDQFTGDNGTNTFADAAPTVSGHRHTRFFIRLEF